MKKIKRWLHPTKGWKEGEPTGQKMPVAVEYDDGTILRDTPKKKAKRKTGGTFIIRAKGDK